MTTLAGIELDQDDAVALLDCQTEVLELMSSGAVLRTVLDRITAALERLLPASRCSVLLLDESAACLRHGSAPSLPAEYLAAIDGLVPGPNEGSCGSAAFLARAVIAVDVLADPRWRRYRGAAGRADLRACWSTPVFGRSGAVVGTFAVYHREVHTPSEREHRVVAQLTYLASVAIEHAGMVGALSISEERFRRAFDDTAVALALLDTRGVFTRVNTALVDLAGSTSGALTGTRLVEAIHVDDRQRVADALGDVADGLARSMQCEARLAAGPNSTPLVLMTLSLVRTSSGEPVQISVTLLDLTARRAAQRERRAREEAELARRAAETSSRAKSAFLSAISHEMRTPLQAITGFAELLGTLDLDAGRREQALSHILAGAAHLLALVDDTLDLSRIEAEALPLQVESMAVGPVVTDVVEFLTPVAEQHRAHITVDDVTGMVRADRRRLRQVLINLVSNGIRYGGPGGVVRVAAAPADDRLRITVNDHGPGIDPALRGRLFEPFTHVGPQSGSDHGVGLGLVLARGLTEAMGGALFLRDGEDAGTEAVVDLPGGPLPL